MEVCGWPGISRESEGTAHGWEQLGDLRLAACLGGSAVIYWFQGVTGLGGSSVDLEGKLAHVEICA